MLNKIIFTSILLLSSAVSSAAQSVDVTIGCVIEGHGGGCHSESIALESVEGAASISVRISETTCYDDTSCEFCHSSIISEYSSSATNYIKVNVETAKNSLLVTEGENQVTVDFYNNQGNYITTQFLIVNASVVEEY